MEKNILVLGGSGFVGTHVCEKLVERNRGGDGSIVVPTRLRAHARHIQLLPTLQVEQADVHDAAQLRRLLRGCDAVVNLVAVLHGSERDFDRVHVQLPRTLAQACREAGVRRIVHVSALGASADAPSKYLRSKAAGEQVLREQRDLDVTILRPSVIFGAEDRFLNLFAGLQRRLPLVPLAAADARFQPVWVEDVARAIVRCLDEPASIGQVYELAGPQVYTLRELVRCAGLWAGHPRPVVGLPHALAWLQALAMEWLPGRTLMSRDNLASMRVPNVASGRLPGLEALGITPVGPAGVAPGYLGHAQGKVRLNLFRAAARRL
ncbi:MAG TPA: complex I NDUFA9 subunit family protein [Burkholderiaceae bacterium]|nr:complex I NDUFA9 subunit family protein [Burkholderiaceae bacterium]